MKKISEIKPDEFTYDQVEAVGRWIGVLDLEQMSKIIFKLNEVIRTQNEIVEELRTKFTALRKEGK